jgi:hypothetical protein
MLCESFNQIIIRDNQQSIPICFSFLATAAAAAAAAAAAGGGGGGGGGVCVLVLQIMFCCCRKFKEAMMTSQ